MLVDHACILKWLNLKPPVARKLAVRHTKLVCLTASFLSTGGFVKLFHKIQWFSMIIQVFFKFHDFSMHGTLFCDFPGFPWFPELVGTLCNRQYLEHKVVITLQSLYNAMLGVHWIGLVISEIMFVCFVSLHPSQQFFSHDRTISGLPGLNQY